MIIKPVLTEKSMGEVRKGKYTFWVSIDMDKIGIKKEVESLFDVNIISVKTINYKGESKKTSRGQKIKTKPKKKAIVEVKEGQKIALFEEKKEKKKKN